MKYTMTKPNPPQGYRMLIEGQDMTGTRDLIWIMDGKSGHRWAHCIKQTDSGLALAADTAKLYKEPKQLEDYYFFRCRKLGHEKQ